MILQPAQRISIALIVFAGFVRILQLLALTNAGSDPILGIDGGAYLMSVNNITGSAQAADFTRPPLSPGVTLAAFVMLLGETHGMIIWATLVSAAFHGAVLLWANRYLRGPRLIAFTGIIAFEPLIGHLVWAGAVVMLPQALLFIAMWAIDTRRPWIVFACTAPLGLLNMPLLAGGAVILGCYWAAAGASRRELYAGLAGGAVSTFLTAPWWWGSFRSPIHNTGSLDIEIVFVGGVITMLALVHIPAAILAQGWIRVLMVLGILATFIVPQDESIYNPQIRMAFAILPIGVMAIIQRYPRSLNSITAAAVVPVMAIVSIVFWAHFYYPTPPEMRQAYERIIENDPDARIFTNDRISAYAAGAWTGRRYDWINFPIGVPLALEGRWESWQCIIGVEDCRSSHSAYVIDRERDRQQVHTNPVDEDVTVWQWLNPSFYWKYGIPRFESASYDYPCWVSVVEDYNDLGAARNFTVLYADPNVQCTPI